MKKQPVCLKSLLMDAGAPPDWQLRGSGETEIGGLAYDSREVKPGDLFVALDGVHTDGHRFAAAALRAGAAGVVHSEGAEELRDRLAREGLADSAGAAFLQVPNTRRAMSLLAAAFYGHPGRGMEIVGVTGTDGKSSTVSYLHQLLTFAGVRAGYLSTVAYDAGDGARKKPCRQSTPEAPVIHRILREMAEQGCTCAVIEATSHGLSPRNSRLADVPFRGAVLTNVTQEHLEFHGTLEQYRRDKAELFRQAAEHPRGFAVINRGDPHHSLFAEAARPAEILLYKSITEEPPGSPEGLVQSLEPELALAARKLQEEPGETRFQLTGREIPPDAPPTEARTGLPGRFNVDNLLAALLAASRITGKSPADLAPLLPRVQGVSGRMEVIRGDQPFTVLVDYAHTPGAFEKILPGLKARCRGRLILVFGSAGERDREKRPRQGALAAGYADQIILTDEDPRLEDRETILREIAAGAEECAAGRKGSPGSSPEIRLIPDRREALRQALAAAQQGDTVAALGKGHEETLIQADGPRPWGEARVLRELLQEAGYAVKS